MMNALFDISIVMVFDRSRAGAGVVALLRLGVLLGGIFAEGLDGVYKCQYRSTITT